MIRRSPACDVHDVTAKRVRPQCLRFRFVRSESTVRNGLGIQLSSSGNLVSVAVESCARTKIFVLRAPVLSSRFQCVLAGWVTSRCFLDADIAAIDRPDYGVIKSNRTLMTRRKNRNDHACDHVCKKCDIRFHSARDPPRARSTVSDRSSSSLALVLRKLFEKQFSDGQSHGQFRLRGQAFLQRHPVMKRAELRKLLLVRLPARVHAQQVGAEAESRPHRARPEDFLVHRQERPARIGDLLASVQTADVERHEDERLDIGRGLHATSAARFGELLVVLEQSAHEHVDNDQSGCRQHALALPLGGDQRSIDCFQPVVEILGVDACAKLSRKLAPYRDGYTLQRFLIAQLWTIVHVWW